MELNFEELDFFCDSVRTLKGLLGEVISRSGVEVVYGIIEM